MVSSRLTTSEVSPGRATGTTPSVGMAVSRCSVAPVSPTVSKGSRRHGWGSS